MHTAYPIAPIPFPLPSQQLFSPLGSKNKKK